MSNFFSILFILSILAGQISKPLIHMGSGITVLDTVVTLFCLVGLVRVKFKLKKPPLFIKSVLLFTLFALLSLALSPLNLTLQEKLISLGYSVRFLLYILTGWLIYSRAFPSFKGKISNILLFSGVGLAILGLLQFIFIRNLWFLGPLGWDPHYFRTVSTFLDPNFVGAYFVLTLLLISQHSNLTKKRPIFLFAIVYLALLTTFSRGSTLAFAVCFTSLAILKKSSKLAIITLALSLGLMAGLHLYQVTIAQLRNIDRVQSARYRVDSWQTGWQIFNRSPILGVGYNSYRYSLRQFKLASADFIQSRGGSGNDSSLLHVAATTGLIGLISFLLFLASLLFLGWRSHLAANQWGETLLAGLLGLITHSFFTNSLFYPFLFVWLMFVAAKTSEYDKR